MSMILTVNMAVDHENKLVDTYDNAEVHDDENDHNNDDNHQNQYDQKTLTMEVTYQTLIHLSPQCVQVHQSDNLESDSSYILR